MSKKRRHYDGGGKVPTEEKPECLEGQTHIWVFPTGTGTTKIFGTRSAGTSFYSGSEVRINYKRIATCRVCEQTYNFGAITSPYTDDCRCPFCLQKKGMARQRNKKSKQKRMERRKKYGKG